MSFKKNILKKVNKSLSSKPKKRSELLILTFVIIFAFFLRINNLEHLEPYTDEYYHLNASQEILNGQNISEVYRRSLFIVTIPTTLSTKLLGQNLFAARLPGVILNTLALIPLYLILRKLNKEIAIIGVIVFAINPWIIAISRNTREYAFYPFIFYFLAYFLITITQQIKKKIVINQTLKKIITKKNILYTFLLITPIIYAILIDPLSTIRVIFLTYIAFFVIIFLNLDFKNKKNKKTLLFLLPVMLISTAVVIILNKTFIDFSGNITSFWITQIFNNQNGQIYSIYLLFPIVIGSIFCLILLPNLRKKNIILFYFIVFGLHLFYFSVLFLLEKT